jgi:hypothetical protein
MVYLLFGNIYGCGQKKGVEGTVEGLTPLPGHAGWAYQPLETT